MHLPLAPLTDGSSPGLVLLMESYSCRAETFMNSWFRSMLEQDVAGHPQQRADGTLRTMGAIEFFKMLNEQVRVMNGRMGSLTYLGGMWTCVQDPKAFCEHFGLCS